MKKQKGFTLIELMVVMAIIAILATAGLSAYTGYIKKARDAKRIADVAAMNTIVLASVSTNGSLPTAAEFVDLVTSMNNGKMIEDPLHDPEGERNQCMYYNVDTAEWVPERCRYLYYSEADTPGVADRCTKGYMISAPLESTSNKSLMKSVAPEFK